jgi:hypothetical protein
MGVGRGKCGVPRRRDARRMGFGSFTSQASRQLLLVQNAFTSFALGNERLQGWITSRNILTEAMAVILCCDLRQRPVSCAYR